ncbi:MAG: helix-turn-helix transcriptional regulator [Longimicrobiaceae bacterium]
MRAAPDIPNIGSVLRAYRQSRGLSQEALGARTGLHRTYIGMIERGEASPTIVAVAAILHVLGVGWRELGDALQTELETR